MELLIIGGILVLALIMGTLVKSITKIREL